MKEIIELVSSILNEIDKMTEPLYQEKEEEGLAYLNKIIEKIEGLIGHIASYQSQCGSKIIDEEQLLGTIGTAFEALQEKDMVLLADIFHYDIKGQLEQIMQENENK